MPSNKVKRWSEMFEGPESSLRKTFDKAVATPKNSEWADVVDNIVWNAAQLGKYEFKKLRLLQDEMNRVIRQLLQERSKDTVGEYEKGYMAALDTKYGLGMGKIIKATKSLTDKGWKIKIKTAIELLEEGHNEVEVRDYLADLLSEQLNQK